MEQNFECHHRLITTWYFNEMKMKIWIDFKFVPICRKTSAETLSANEDIEKFSLGLLLDSKRMFPLETTIKIIFLFKSLPNLFFSSISQHIFSRNS